MRTSGVLMHISSLPGGTGIGTLGKKAYEFVDFLKKSKQSYWQVLPIGPTSYGDSPYQSFSTFAGNPYFIDFDLLCEDGLLREEDYKSIDWGNDLAKVDYNKLYKNRFDVLKIATENFQKNIDDEYDTFCKKNNFWLSDYSLFMSLKDEYNGKSFLEWDNKIKLHNQEAVTKARERLSVRIDFWKNIQYFFYKQWFNLKRYANENGIKIIGDIPIYVALDSADVWANYDNFLLDSERNPIKVAGCPPDCFSKDGQLWGNPLYDWNFMKNNKYEWWKNRIKFQSSLFDVVRIDHFRGFESYYAIPYYAKTAKIGEWEKGPGIEFFKNIEKDLGKLNLIAEDLGFLTPEVKKMLRQSRYPGMKILQFAFDSVDDNDYTLHNFNKNSIAYTGTHDNDTIIGYLKHSKRKTSKRAKEYLRLNRREGYNWGMIKALLSSNSNTVIITMQDLLGLDSDARMNTPSTVTGNWQWRALNDYLSDDLSEKLRYYTEIYKRVPKKRGNKNEFNSR